MSYLRFLMSQPLENRDRSPIASTAPKKVEVSKPILKKKQEVGLSCNNQCELPISDRLNCIHYQH